MVLPNRYDWGPGSIQFASQITHHERALKRRPMKQKELRSHQPKTQGQGITWWHYLLPTSLLATITALFYYPSLTYNFQFDDIANITKHFDIRHNTLNALFFSGTRWISYWLNAVHYSIGGFNPFSYRVGNVLIHISNGLLVFGILWLALRNLKQNNFFKINAYTLALLTSTLFLLHPVHTQTVSYVIQGQLEGLSTFFILSMVLCLLNYAYARSSTSRFMSACGLFVSAILACGTKEIAIIAPALLLLVDWFFIAQGEFKEIKQRLLLHLSLSLLIIGIYLWFLKPAFFTEILGLQKIVRNNIGNVITHEPTAQITPWAFLISQFKVILHYLWIFVWPFGISVEYDWMLSKNFFALDSFIPFLVLCTLAFGVVVLS